MHSQTMDLAEQLSTPHKPLTPDNDASVHDRAIYSRPIRVLLVEDDFLTAQRLMNQCSIDGRVQIVLWAATAEEAIAGVGDISIDMALVDLGLPDASGVEVIRYLSCQRTEVESLVLSVFGDSGSVIEAVRAGASGYLLKGQSDGAAVINGLVDVARGEASISPVIARHLLNCFREPIRLKASGRADAIALESMATDKASELGSLTRREIELLKLVAHGYLVKEIARKLCLSPYTVSTHFKNVYRKLHVKTRSEAVFLAQQAGLI